MPGEVEGVPDEAVTALAERFWKLRSHAEGLPAWEELSDEERRAKLILAKDFIRVRLAPSIRFRERQRVEETESAYTSLCHELARLLGPIKPHMGTTTNEQLIAKVGQVLIERDEAAKRERQRVREEALSDKTIKAAREAEARWHRADTPDTEAISLVEYVLRAALNSLEGS